MKTQELTEDKKVVDIINQLKEEIAGKAFSDVVDEEGNQYVDLVQEGGGVLGIALLGYTYVLEQVGIRFFSLAGTSAGAINTLMVAAVDNVDKPKTEKIIDLLVNKNLYDFVDGPFFIKAFLGLLKGGSNDPGILRKLFKYFIVIFKIISILLLGLLVLPYFFITKGFNPGKNFHKWISEILKTYNIRSTADLAKRRQVPAGLKIRQGVNKTVAGLEPKLKIIVAEITTETRVIFPEMKFLFWDNPDNVNPADYVRSSMSIPFFFHPFVVNKGKEIKASDWMTAAKYCGELPEKFYFVDGGILSNFPIDVFHNHKIIPRLPTFGVKLGDDRDQVHNVNRMTKFLLSMFNSARHILDFEFMLKNADYEKLIQKIDIGEHSWLNFSIKDEEKKDLFRRGALAAAEFLRKFDWDEYKNIREKLLQDNMKILSA